MYIKNIALGLALSLSVSVANAAVLFDNINISPSGLDWGGNGISNAVTGTDVNVTPAGPIAASFFNPTASTLSSVTLRLSQATELSQGSFVVYLVPDDGTGGGPGLAGAPTTTGSGATLAFTGAITLFVGVDGMLTDEPNNYTFATSQSLSAGVYWIGMTATDDSSAQWWYNKPPVSGEIGSAGQSIHLNG